LVQDSREDRGKLEVSDTVSAGEAARRLGVAPATIQRWVDRGVLHAERTPGGHRRIYLTEVRRLIAANRTSPLSGPLADWLDVLMAADPVAIRAALLAARKRSASWAETVDEVASALAEIGRRWEAGSCHVFEEHAASEALRRAVAACAGGLHPGGNAPSAALLTVEGERHTLGLSLAELVLAEAGWRSIWIGEGPPVEELEGLVAKLKPELLSVSASAASPPAAIVRYQSELMRIASTAQTRLVLAGSGAWRDFPPARRVVSFTEFQTLLDGGLP
jgi:excisionase family DNA binding protein